MRDLHVVTLGTVPYREALDLQHRFEAARQADAIPDTLLLLEHPPTYTRGRRTGPGELPLGDDWYAERGIEIVDADRGGKVTYHGPGQLVGYPIMRVRSAREHVRTIEDALVAALRDEGVPARSRPDEGPEHIGVWVQERKIASVGVHVSRGITTHGFAVNVDNDLEPWSWIVPCGLTDVRMTSLRTETAAEGALMRCFRKRAAWRFAQAVGARQRLVSVDRALTAVQRNLPLPA